ncbi:unnamed protein product [Rhizophagus irregularis]|uniref:Uncharacterized protein n=1 Tax=Rhizophagus irregularis TaxID=588596 RepID=A0A2I1G3P9_9GLOM|nr:hypothetical protein RhiirA4_454807 [Rhizophagus irregularis]CAB4406800.1 unnamed protein product [Rhizophagus irregularis]
MVDCCCCCIPVRLGTIILAVITLIISISGASAYLGKPDVILPGFPHGVATLFGFLFILMALISIFGIIGSFFSSPGAVKLFEWMLWGFVLAFVVMSGVTIYSTIKNKQLAIDNCIADLQQDADKTFGDINSSNADKVVISDITNTTTNAINDKISGNFPDICKERIRIKIWVTIIVSLIITLFGAYFAGVVSRFADAIKPRNKRDIPTSHVANVPDTKYTPTLKEA